MPLYEITFRISHDCPFGNISRKLQSLKMFAWCNRKHDVIEFIVREQEDYPALMKEISNLCGVVSKISDRGKVHLVTKNCSCNPDNSVVGNIDAANLLQIMPTIYKHGWEYYRVIAFRHEDVENFLQRIQEKGFQFEILSKIPFNGSISSSLTLTADSLFSNLTEKQINALLTAYNSGYYLLPRKADVKEIAFRKQVPRTTFQEHLNKAENKLIATLIPYIQIFKNIPFERKTGIKIKN
jgi:predicted DNA binding protein